VCQAGGVVAGGGSSPIVFGPAKRLTVAKLVAVCTPAELTATPSKTRDLLRQYLSK
jgi:hypothetical protein